MSIEPARHARLWCVVINSILLALWSIQFVLPRRMALRLKSIGFSQKMCFPTRAASTIRSAWLSVGEDYDGVDARVVQ